jgi:hypothetical protein
MTSAFSGVIVRVRQHQFASMHNIQEFVGGVVAAFTSTDGQRAVCALGLEEAVVVFDELMCLIPARHMELYVTAVEKALRVIMLQRKPAAAAVAPMAASAPVSVVSQAPADKALYSAPQKLPTQPTDAKPVVRQKEAQRATGGVVGYAAGASSVLSKFPNQASQYDARPASDAVEGSGTWQPSKRAKLLAEQTVPGPKVVKPGPGIAPGAVKPSPLAFLNNRSNVPPPPPSQRQIQAAAAAKAPRPPTGSSTSRVLGSPGEDVLNIVSGFKFGTKGANFVEQMCNVCMETARRPCANKQCGHVCCESCWKRWLESKTCSNNSCPVCRQPASVDSLVFLVQKT